MALTTNAGDVFCRADDLFAEPVLPDAAARGWAEAARYRFDLFLIAAEAAEAEKPWRTR